MMNLFSSDWDHIISASAENPKRRFSHWTRRGWFSGIHRGLEMKLRCAEALVNTDFFPHNPDVWGGRDTSVRMILCRRRQKCNYFIAIRKRIGYTSIMMRSFSVSDSFLSSIFWLMPYIFWCRSILLINTGKGTGAQWGDSLQAFRKLECVFCRLWKSATNLGERPLCCSHFREPAVANWTCRRFCSGNSGPGNFRTVNRGVQEGTLVF